jgi:hypothetical protein
MDDGGADRSGFIFYTNGFSKDEVIYLSQILNDKFNLKTSIHVVKRTHYVIYIKAEYFSRFKSLVSPYFIPHFNYKLQLRKKIAPAKKFGI